MGFVADIFGGNKAAKAQIKAADKSAAASQYATDQSLALQREQFDRMWGATQPGRDLGNAAIGKINALNNGTVNATDWIKNTPAYQTNLDAGQRQINASMAAKGGLMSGDAAKAGLKYGADYANNLFNQERNALMAQAGLGQTATAQGGAAGQNMANNGQNALFNNANNLASSYGQKADAKAGFWGNMTGLFGSNGFANMAGSFMKGFGG